MAGRFGIGAVVADAFHLAINRPDLWLLGAAGFLVRGGFFLLLFTVVSLPSPVQLRLLIGDGLGSTGFSGGAVAIAAVLALLTSVLLLTCLWLLAAIELWTIQRTLPEAAAVRLTRDMRRRTISWIFVAEALGLMLVGLAILPLIAGATAAAYNELVMPTGGGSLYGRIFAGVVPQIVGLGLAVVIGEAVSAVGTRYVLGRAFGLPTPAGRGRWRPVVAILGWTVGLAILAPMVWALGAVWRWVSGALLGVNGSALNPLVMVLAVALLAGVWGAVVMVAGFASALRGALWTMQELRQDRPDTLTP